jgi:hypothetical protein
MHETGKRYFFASIKFCFVFNRQQHEYEKLDVGVAMNFQKVEKKCI